MIHSHRGCGARHGRLRELSDYRPKTGNRNQTSIHKAAHGLRELARPASPLTRHVRLRNHPGPGYGHAVDRHSTTSAAPTAVTRARPSTSCSASPKFSGIHLRSSSEACVPSCSTCPSAALIKKKFTAKAPAVRRACTSCHSGKTRCSEILPCQVGTYLYAPS